jgi:hypothetical protein
MMTNEQRYEDLIQLGHRLRARLRGFVEELNAIPDEQGPVGMALITWRVALLTLMWDVSEAPLTLAAARTEQIRAMRMLNRSLFEYALRLEYYAYDHRQASKDWINSEAWLKSVVKIIEGEDIARWTKAERRAYNEMVKVQGEFEYQSLPAMLQTVFKGRSYPNRVRRKAVRHGTNFYSIASSFVHGSQGAFYDLFEQVFDGPAPLHLRSYRFTEFGMLHETLFYMILAVYAESCHRNADLGASMYWRELDLVSGKWIPTYIM